MNGVPTAVLAWTGDPSAIAGVGAVLATQLCAGFGATGLRSRVPAWALAVVTLLATLHLVDRQPAGMRMLAIVATLLLAMKIVVATGETIPLSFRQWIAFTLWPGMRPSIFTTLGSPPRDDSGPLARRGIRGFVAGVLFLGTARGLASMLAPEAARVLATPFLLVGLSLVLHFGLLNLFAAWWRTRGVPAERLFHDPLHATSLADFWSRRWNLGFTEMTAVAIHRPITRLAGRNVGIFASFLASGLLHELAISVPARGGYGLPTLYFAFHGVLVLSGTRSRAVMFLALIAPILLVFHLPFLRAVLWPLVGIR